ncbi:ABC transporter permease [Streptomyces sp. NBC_01341]|uniref:ABC transporter permease n=1 Tax=Streptomyces sp. NBC_01341 TaxID=2903831 RepID=UPI002E14C970|nr:ABC transporter permease [Streptomyces sp. NBC_01341]
MLLVPLIVALALWALAWPAARIAPRDLPVGIAGAAPAVDQLQERFEREEGAFEIHRYEDETAARTAIENRVVYGAVVVTAQGPRLLTASAASPVVSQLPTGAVAASAPGGAGERIAQQHHQQCPQADARGAQQGGEPRHRRADRHHGEPDDARLRPPVAGDHAEPAVGHGGRHEREGARAERAAAGVGVRRGDDIGDRHAGVTSAPELLPAPVGTLGQWLPPGAGGSLLRSAAFFDGHAAGGPALTLALWAVLGLTAVLVGGRRHRDDPAPHTEAADRTPEPALT